MIHHSGNAFMRSQHKRTRLNSWRGYFIGRFAIRSHGKGGCGAIEKAPLALLLVPPMTLVKVSPAVFWRPALT